MDKDNHHDKKSIAIVGMGCRLPGRIDSPSGFWDLILAGHSPQSDKVPPSRFNVDAFYASNNERPGSFNVRGGYFLEDDPTEFDPTFFGITPVEATWMDPQQRKLLEVVYEALESSGTPLHKVFGSLTGCFVGSFTNDFQQMSFKENDFRHTYSATGVDTGILANRIAHVFNLHGPSAVINTACSSSLAALHMACAAIRNQDCEAALVGGSNLVLTTDQHMNTAKLGILSPTSQCHTFDESADGYARAEGVGALYIKSLTTALRDGDPVRAVIRSTAMNSNVGHSEASSSITTIIKVVLAIENEIIPPTAGIVNLNTRIPWKEWCVQPVTEPTQFPACLPKRRIGVNASGYGGTNLHAIIENLRATDQPPQEYKSFHKAKVPDRLHTAPSGPNLLVFSAHDKPTLARNIKRYSEMSNPPDLIDLAYTLAERRSILTSRAYTICRQDSISADILGALQTVRTSVHSPRIGFVFTGCLTGSETFVSVNDPEISQPLCTAIQIGIVQLLAKWNILPVITVGHSSGEIAAAFTAGHLSSEDAIRIAFYRGIVVASATANGAMLAVSLSALEVLPYLEGCQDQVVVACHNSPESVTLSGDAEAIHELEAYFGARQIFVRKLRTSGKAYHSHHMASAALEYTHLLKSTAVGSTIVVPMERRCLMISTVSNDFVTNEVTDPVYWALNLEKPVLFNQAIHKLTELAPSIDMIVEIGPHPALSGPIRQISAEADLVLSYLPTLKREENDTDQLLKLAGELWAKGCPIDISAVTSIERPVRGDAVEKVSGTLLVDLPPYQWNYSRKYLSEPRQSREHRNCQHARHDLLGRRIPGLSLSEPQWRNMLRLSDLPWLRDHTLGQEVVFPAAGYFAMAMEAATQMNADSVDPLDVHCFALRNVSLKAALVVPDDENGVETLFVIHSCKTGPTFQERNAPRQWYTFSVSSIAAQENIWTEHAVGMVGMNMGPKNPPAKRELHLSSHASALTLSTKPDVMDVVALLCHKKAATRILDIGGSLASELMKTNASVDITVSVSAEEPLHNMEAAFEEHPSIKIVELDTASERPGSSSDTVYDLVIAFEVIILAEPNEAILTDLRDNELRNLQDLAQTSTRILWVTAGGLLTGWKPEHAMVSGLARCLRSENVALELVTVDINTKSTTVEQMTDTVAMFADAQGQTGVKLEAEYLVDNGIVYISRVASIDNMGATSTSKTEFSALHSGSVLKASILSGKLYFQEQDESLQLLATTHAEVKILAVGISKARTSDIAETEHKVVSAYEIGGIVTALGSEISHLKVGDRIVGFSDDGFSTCQRVSAAQLCRLDDKDSLETVIILDNTGTTGLAAVQICRIIHANFIIVTEKEDLHAFLLDSGFTEDQIILCESENISYEIRRRTQGSGADVLFSENLADDILQDCALNIAPFGRVILVGGRTPHLNGLKEMSNSSELSVSVFDMVDLYQRKPKTAARLLRKCVQYYSDGLISNATSIHSYSVSEVDEVISRVSDTMMSGKTVISYDNNPLVKTIPSQPSLRFDPDAVYLLVGCLGGVGRSLTSWMVDRGVRHLAFMARSGAERPAAAKLVSSIEARGVEVTVFRGDVARREDVETVVHSISQLRELRGVVNAAMVLNDKLFPDMDLPSWRQTVDPKVAGSLYLHEAVRALPLDFFVLLSSTSGILGTPGQSNYAAANAYQDALALHRRTLNLPAVSLILPMILGIGHVADNPEIEDSLLRKGIYGIHEDELLAGFEVAMMPPPHDDERHANIILGLQPSRLAHSVAQPETTDAFWLHDIRFSAITARMARYGPDTPNPMVNTSSALAAMRLAKPDALAAIATHIRARLARLLNLDVGDIVPNTARSVASFGLDSMIGTEFRNWLFREFGADVPFQRLLASNLTVEGLAEACYDEVVAGGE
ncbi:MAG: hypothetical protein Q9208_007943 [Pyrenodesmia sp. 3 TL-2023]